MSKQGSSYIEVKNEEISRNNTHSGCVGVKRDCNNDTKHRQQQRNLAVAAIVVKVVAQSQRWRQQFQTYKRW